MTVPSDDADTVHSAPATPAPATGSVPPEGRTDPVAARRGIRQRTSGVPYRAYRAAAAPAAPGAAGQYCPAASAAFEPGAGMAAEPAPPVETGHPDDMPHPPSGALRDAAAPPEGAAGGMDGNTGQTGTTAAQPGMPPGTGAPDYLGSAGPTAAPGHGAEMTGPQPRALPDSSVLGGPGPAGSFGLSREEADALRLRLGAQPGTGFPGEPGTPHSFDTASQPAQASRRQTDAPPDTGDPGAFGPAVAFGLPGHGADRPGLQPGTLPGAGGYSAFTGADTFMPGPTEDKARPDSARVRRLKLALMVCGAAVTVGMGIAIALLMEEGTPPLRLGTAGTRTAAHAPAAPAPGYDSSGQSGAAPGHAGAGTGGDAAADAACPLPGGPAACPAMVAIPAGRYRMGAARNDPEAQDEELGGTERPVAAFELSAHEITAGQWQLCVNDGACPPPAQPAESSVMPVTGISWDAAVAYTAWLSQKTGRQYRLPTEAEWEYAARAGAGTVFPWGDRLGQRNAHCGQCGTLDAYPRFAPVGSYPARRGLYDMVGNAYEWVADCWTPNHRQPLPPSRAACRDKVQKGGAFDTLEADVRPVARTYGDRATPDARVGFRVARQLPPVPPTQRGQR